MEFIFWLSVTTIFYAYFGYPLALKLLSLFKGRKKSNSEAKLFSFSIIVTARNEESGIKEKIENCLEIINRYQKLGGQAELIVASDASEDRTEDIVNSFSEQKVRLVRSKVRKGKEFAQKLAVNSSKQEIVFFTDVRARLEPDALEKASSYFSDPQVGAISSKDVIVTEGESSGEGFYVRYEMLLRDLESKYFSLIGLSGSGFAVRRELCLEMEVDKPSDFSILLSARKAGLIGRQANDVTCHYKAVKTQEQEFERKIRTVLRGLTTFFATWDNSFFSKDPKFAWQLISHKLFRWLVPWGLVLATISLTLISQRTLFYHQFSCFDVFLLHFSAIWSIFW